MLLVQLRLGETLRWRTVHVLTWRNKPFKSTDTSRVRRRRNVGYLEEVG